MSFVSCVVDEDYEIYNEYPFYTRRKKNKRIVKEGVETNGYIYVYLNGVRYRKHRIIAIQFIQNDNPLIKTEVDHMNHDRSDYHIKNLRWVSRSDNTKNKSSNNGVEYEFIEEEDLPDDLIEVNDYGKHKFEGYYYSPETNLFYYDTGAGNRVLHINRNKRTGSAFVNMYDKDKKRVQVYYIKFKKLYNFI